MPLILIQCDIAGRCFVCDTYTPWRLEAADAHLCSGECVKEASDMGMLKMFTNQRESSPDTLGSAFVFRSEAPSGSIQ